MCQKGGDFLLDSGATTSMITESYYNSLVNPPPIYPTDMWVTVADGYKVHCRGLLITTCRVGGRNYAVRVLVMDRLGGDEDGILGMDFMYIFDCHMNFRTGKLSLEDGDVVVWANPETKVLGARAKSAVVCRPKEFTHVPLKMPEEEENDWAFKLRGEMCSSMALGGSDCVIKRDKFGVWVWNNSMSNIKILRSEVVGGVEPCEVVEINDIGGELCNYEDDIGEDKLFPDIMPPEIQCPLNKLILESHLETADQEREALEMVRRCKIAFALPG